MEEMTILASGFTLRTIFAASFSALTTESGVSLSEILPAPACSIIAFKFVKFAASSEFGTYCICEQRRFR